MEEKIKSKEELKNLLRTGDARDFANLWQCADNAKHYSKFLVKELPANWQTWDWKDNSKHLYGGVFSLNDGKISTELKEWFENHDLIDVTKGLIFVNTDEYTEKEQVFFLYHNGTNGKECNALNSMKDACTFLEKLQKETRWATLLGALCDTADDVYTWYYTFEL